MGEYSKRVGEVGENVVVDFLKIIGWNDPQRNVDIRSVNLNDSNRRTNGYDGYFHYLSPMISNTIENVLFSSKYSTSPYPTNPITKFKEYYNDLADAIQSFKKSEIKQQTISLHHSVDTFFDRGVLFWLNNSDGEETDLISKLGKIELNSKVVHDGIFLVDNRRIEFIYDSISFAMLNYRDYEIDFIYFNTGQNYDEATIRNGKIMPVQYINASVLPLRAHKNGETIVILFSIDRFDKIELMKLMGIAKSIGWNAQGKTIICFPNYLQTEHIPIVENVKQIFDDSSFTTNLSISNYNNPILK
jgi:hypothetical protein